MAKAKKKKMIKRKDGSYSQRGLWDNIRAKKGSGKKPTKEMLEQEREIKKEASKKKKYYAGGKMKKYDKGGITPKGKQKLRYRNGKISIVSPYPDDPINEGGLLDEVGVYSKRITPLVQNPYDESGYVNEPKYSFNPFRRIKQKIATNIMPSSYGRESERFKAALGMEYDGKFENSTSPEKVRKRKINQITDSNPKTNWMSERQQLFNNILNLPMDSYIGADLGKDGLRTSEYKPTDAKDPNNIYFRSNVVEKEMRDKLKHISDVDSSLGGGNFSSNTGGQMTITKGKDSKGKYISYYDIWDLDPFKKGSSTDFGNKVSVGPINVKRSTANNISNFIQGIAGFNTPEIYGRLYYDEGPNGEMIFRSIEDEREALHGERLARIMNERKNR